MQYRNSYHDAGVTAGTQHHIYWQPEIIRRRRTAEGTKPAWWTTVQHLLAHVLPVTPGTLIIIRSIIVFLKMGIIFCSDWSFESDSNPECLIPLEFGVWRYSPIKKQALEHSNKSESPLKNLKPTWSEQTTPPLLIHQPVVMLFKELCRNVVLFVLSWTESQSSVIMARKGTMRGGESSFWGFSFLFQSK